MVLVFLFTLSPLQQRSLISLSGKDVATIIFQRRRKITRETFIRNSKGEYVIKCTLVNFVRFFVIMQRIFFCHDPFHLSGINLTLTYGSLRPFGSIGIRLFASTTENHIQKIVTLSHFLYPVEQARKHRSYAGSNYDQLTSECRI